MFTIIVYDEPFADYVEGVQAACESTTQDVCHLAAEVAAEVGAEAARRFHTYKDQTGALTASIIAQPSGDEYEILAEAEHASWIDEGTAAHEIRPLTAQALHFWQGGEERFAKSVQHPGTRAYNFLRDAGVVAEQELEIQVNRMLPRALRQILIGEEARAEKGTKNAGKKQRKNAVRNAGNQRVRTAVKKVSE